MIKEAIHQLAAKHDLSYDTAAAVMDEIMGGQASPIQMSAFLTALAMKGETIDEITACAASMRAHCVRLLHDLDALEIVGTGGDGANSFNISTTSALWWPPAAFRSPSTATARPPPNAAPPTCWRRWESTSPCPRNRAPSCWRRSVFAFSLPKTTIFP